MKNNFWRVVLCILGLGLTFELVVDSFLAESTAIGWHLRQGFHAELQGLRFRVPVLYYENHSPRMLELSFSTLPGRLNKRDATITVDFHKQPPLPPETAGLRETRMNKFGMQQSRTESLRMAGLDGTCTHFVAMAENASSAHVVDCTFADDLHVHFNGSENALPDFYAIIRSAEIVKGNH